MLGQNFNIKNRALKSRDFFLNLLFPIECLGCGKEKFWLCDECFKKLRFNQTQYCLKCKKENNLGYFCYNCQENYSLDGCLIAGDYQDKLLSLLIKNFKYRFIKNLNAELGNFAVLFLYNLQKNIIEEYPAYPKIFINLDSSIVVPVPLHKKRLNWRGFNQSEKIAEIIAKSFELNLSLELFREKYKKPQAKLKAKKRKENIKNCFVWKGENLKNSDILLIDDVTTTGSTLNECAKVLKQNGARKIWGLVIANG